MREIELEVRPALLHAGRRRDDRRVVRERPGERLEVQRAVGRDPLAGVQVEAAVAVDLHVLRGVGPVPVGTERGQHDGRRRGEALRARRLRVVVQQPARPEEEPGESGQSEHEHEPGVVDTEVGEQEPDGAEAGERERRAQRDDTYPSRFGHVAHAAPARSVIQAGRERSGARPRAPVISPASPAGRTLRTARPARGRHGRDGPGPLAVR